ncbi:MAG: group III truncated hemoglobin [Ferruginibacter sp.]
MKKDIRNRIDIELFVNNFYDRVKTDPVIGYIFTEIAKVNWERHLPVMYNFWENALFYSGTYKGNPLELHKHLHRVMPLEPRHFDQWIRIFNETIDELFNGPKADLAKERAYSIAQIMQRNILKG